MYLVLRRKAPFYLVQELICLLFRPCMRRLGKSPPIIVDEGYPALSKSPQHQKWTLRPISVLSRNEIGTGCAGERTWNSL